jgi:hypothetical protein
LFSNIHARDSGWSAHHLNTLKVVNSTHLSRGCGHTDRYLVLGGPFSDTAKAEVMFKEGGRSPAGRTIQTIYPSDYQNQISIFDFNMRPGSSKFVRPDCNQTCDTPPMHGGPCGSCTRFPFRSFFLSLCSCTILVRVRVWFKVRVRLRLVLLVLDLCRISNVRVLEVGTELGSDKKKMQAFFKMRLPICRSLR